MSEAIPSRTRLVQQAVGLLGPIVCLYIGLCLRPAIAQRAVAPGQPETAAAQVPQAGEVSLDRSRVYVHVGKTGLGHEHAVEGRLKSGALHLQGQPSSGELVFDMASFVADTPGARKYIGLTGSTDAATRAKVTANMLGPHVLNVRHDPTARFVVKAITPQPNKSRRGLSEYTIEGEFTLRGRTRVVQISADAEQHDGWLHLRGGFPIQQTQFGITPYSTALGAIGVADRLMIWGDLWVAGQPQLVDQGTAATRQ